MIGIIIRVIYALYHDRSRSDQYLKILRQFKTDPIPRNIIETILAAGSKAASGSNTQPWEFTVVEDPEVKARLIKPMLDKWLARISGSRMRGRMKEVYDEATEMLRNTAKVPVMIYCCLDLNRTGIGEEVRYASIYPAVQNMLLASHCLGLGTCLTIHGSTPTRGEPEVKRILGIPEHVKIACLVYLGYPLRKHKPPRRTPIMNFVHYGQW
ncbi:MAG TPA: nitroreductase family protein [Candidatus Bathyarchaeia archaeon]|nr:nitroreductase family protein [Candidatus Bathyarchaeia archaeon]